MSQADSLTLHVAFFKNKLDNDPKPVCIPWEKLAVRLTQHQERTDKDGPLWSPAHYLPSAKRANAGVMGITAAVGDFDDGASWEEVASKVDGYEYVAHSTFSNDPEHPKFRVVIPFCTPVMRQDWPAIKARIDYHVFGLASDPAAKDASRIYYLPSCPPDALRFAQRHEGQLLDPRALPEVPERERTASTKAGEGRCALGRAALDFVANGAPLLTQRTRALAATRNYLAAGYSVADTAAAIWRGFQACQQIPEKGPWTYADAEFIATNLFNNPPSVIDIRTRTVIEDGPVPSGFTRIGMGYTCEFPASHIKFTVDHIRRSSEGLSGEVLVEAELPTIPQHLHWARLNMSSTSARSTLQKFLASRTQGIQIDWTTMLEILCRKVALSEREGEPFADVGLDDPEEATWLVQDYAPLGEAMTVYGDGGVGKSMLSLAVAMSIKSGLEFVPGFTPLSTGEALYLDWEAGRARINARMQALCRGLGVPPFKIRYRRCHGPFVDQIEEVLLECDQHNVIFVVVDSVEMAISGSGNDAGDPNEKVTKLHSGLRWLKATTALVDHISAAGAGTTGGAGKPIGGVAKRNLARMVYEMRKATNVGEGSMHVALYNTKRNDDGPLLRPRGIKIEYGPGLVRYGRDDITDAALVEGMTVPDQIDALLRGQSRSRKFIVDNVKGKAGTIDTALSRGTDKGNDSRWIRLPNGDYGLPEKRRESFRVVEEIPF